MFFSALSRFINCSKIDKAIIADRERKRMSYKELSEKYGKSEKTIKKIWYNSLGLSYLGQKVLIKDLPIWTIGLQARAAMALIEAGFKNKFQLLKFLNGKPENLLKIDKIGKSYMIKIINWLNK